MIVLVSEEGVRFKLSEKSVKISEILISLHEDVTSINDDDIENNINEIVLPYVKTHQLEAVCKYCVYYDKDPMLCIPRHSLITNPLEFIQPWYNNYMNGYSINEWAEIYCIADYLHINPLLDLCGYYMSLVIRNKTPVQIYELFGIQKINNEQKQMLFDESLWLHTYSQTEV